MTPREFWVELGGDPSDDKEVYKRYCAAEKFEPTSYAEEVIHFIEYSAFEKLQIELWQAKGALGYSVPGNIPVGELKCGLCEAKYNSIKKLESENNNLKKIIAKEVGDNDEFGSEFVIANILRAENQKLKQLLLLTDPAVSNVEMNTLSAKQWAEFLRWQEAEGYNANN